MKAILPPSMLVRASLRHGLASTTIMPRCTAVAFHTRVPLRQQASNSNEKENIVNEASSSSTSSSSSIRKDEEEEQSRRRRQNVLTQLRDVMYKKRSDLEPRIKQRLEELGRRWNAYSGYEEVQEAKALVLEAELELKELREQQTTMRQAYMQAVATRASSQRTLNELLTRKDSWSEADLSTYTELLKSEHSNARGEKDVAERYEAIANRVNATWDDVVRKTLDRYHQEQIWSDRVRAGSTYGSLVIAGINVAVFILAFLVVEPYKRKRLAQTFESRLLKGEQANAQQLAAVVQDFERHVEALDRQGVETNTALARLMAKAGIASSAADEQQQHAADIDAAAAEGQDVPITATAPTRSAQSTGEKRRDMATAGALGFAIGAGLLAAFGALQS